MMQYLQKLEFREKRTDWLSKLLNIIYVVRYTKYTTGYFLKVVGESLHVRVSNTNEEKVIKYDKELYRVIFTSSNLLDYQKDASRTCPNLVEKYNFDSADSLHMTIGMMTEVQEIFSCVLCLNNKSFDVVNLSEELADLMWYLANYCSVLQLKKSYDTFEFSYELYDLKEKTYDVSYFELLLNFVGELLDFEKKKFAYGKVILTSDKEVLVLKILKTLSNIFSERGIDVTSSLRNNIHKLKVRYPEKFTVENAINRDLQKERKELEK